MSFLTDDPFEIWLMRDEAQHEAGLAPKSGEQLAEMRAAPLPQISNRVAELEAKVSGHLERMGFAVKG